MTVDRNQFGKNLRTLLKERKLSQVDIAKKTGIGRVAINRWICGVSFPSADYLAIMAKALNVTMDELLKDVVKE